MYEYTIFYLIHSPIDGYMGFLYFLAIIKNAAVNIHILLFVWTRIFLSLG